MAKDKYSIHYARGDRADATDRTFTDRADAVVWAMKWLTPAYDYLILNQANDVLDIVLSGVHYARVEGVNGESA
jgi:hypothetical protein